MDEILEDAFSGPPNGLHAVGTQRGGHSGPGLPGPVIPDFAEPENPDDDLELPLAVDELSEDNTPQTQSIEELDRADGIASAGKDVEPSRPRAQELTSSLKVVPHLDHSYTDKHSFKEEIENYFDLLPSLAPFLETLRDRSWSQRLDVTHLARDAPAHPWSALYFALGTYGSVNSLSDHLDRMQTNTTALVQAGILDRLKLPSEADQDDQEIQMCTLSLWFLAALFLGPTVAETLASRKVSVELFKSIASKRWDSVNDLPLLGAQISLLRILLLSEFGAKDEKLAAEKYNYRLYGLDEAESVPNGLPNTISSSSQNGLSNGASTGTENGHSSELQPSATPYDYEAFRTAVTLRYPTYEPPESVSAGTSQPSRFPATHVDNRRGQSLPTVSMPEVPASIKEACHLFRARTRTTPQILQLWKEYESFVRAGLYIDIAVAQDDPESQSPDQPLHSPESLARVEVFYSETIVYHKSFLTVLANYMLQENIVDAQPTGLHAAAALVRLLLEWYKLSHVLKYEFLAAVLFDLQFHLITFKFCSQHPILDTVVLPTLPVCTFWGLTKGLSTSRDIPDSLYGLVSRAATPATRISSATEGVRIERFSIPLLETFVALTNITREIITDKTQRIIIVAELPADPLKQLMAAYNHDLWQQVLHIFKLQTPFNGKKWRYMNMELISAIYLHCESKLNDAWLTGTDVVSEIKAASSQEEALRELIEVYNARIRTHKVEKEMAMLDLQPQV